MAQTHEPLVWLILHPSAFILPPFGTIGMLVSRRPVAWKIALPIAGATATIGVSPAPADGKSLRSTRTVSRIGKSLNLGTR